MEFERTLPLSAVHNFRDYGGYPVAGGGRVKRGLLWRSGHMAEASEADLGAIDDLELAYVFDLRGPRERESMPSLRGPAFAAEVVAFDGESGSLAPHLAAAGEAFSAADAHAVMEKVYAALPDRVPLVTMIQRFFDAQLRGEGASLIHCHAGKDRTGMAVALLHEALGVHPDDAMADFLLTNTSGDRESRIALGVESIRRRYPKVSEKAAEALMGVQESYLLAARGALEERYGSVDAYLTRELGIDENARETLRLHLVET